MVMLFYHLINSTHVRTCYSSSFSIFPLRATNRAQLSWTSLALSGLQWSFLNLHLDLHRPKDAPLQNAHLHPKRSLLVQGSAICRGILWVWSPGSCTLNLGICSDCNCNWFLKSAGKSHPVFDVKHSCISHKEGLFQKCEAFQSPAMRGSGKHSGWFVFERVMCSYGLYSVSDLLEWIEELFCIRAAVLNFGCFGERRKDRIRSQLGTAKIFLLICLLLF